MSDTESTPVGDGVVRISWTADTTIDAVRLTVASAFDEGAHRVEAYVDPGDVTAQRAATFSGLRKEGISRGIDARELKALASGYDKAVWRIIEALERRARLATTRPS